MSTSVVLRWTCVLALVWAAAAQNADAKTSLQGRVEDETGAVIAGAAVRLLSADGAVRTAVRSAMDGSFAISGQPPGEYRLQVTAPGFATWTNGVRLEAGAPSEAVVSMKLASLNSAVNVEAPAGDPLRAAVEADYNQNKSSTSVLGGTAVEWNPVANYDVLRLLPGVMSPAGGGKDRFSVPTNIRGAGAWGTVETVDDYPGANITPVSAEDGGYTASFSSIIPGIALRSVTLATGGLGVSFGQAAGGVVRSTIKQGAPGRQMTSLRAEGTAVGQGEGSVMGDTGGGIGRFDYYIAGQSVVGEYGDAFSTYARPIRDLRLYSGLVKAGYRVAPGSRLEGMFIGGNENHSYFQNALVQGRTIRRDYHTEKENYFAAARYDYRPSDDTVFGAGLTHSRFHENRVEDAADGTPVGISRRNRPQWATRGFLNTTLRRDVNSDFVYSGSGGAELTWDRFSDITTIPIGFSFREQAGYWRNTATVFKRLSLIGGVRLSFLNNGMRDLRRTTYDIGASYLLPTQTRLKFSRSSGFKLNKAFYLWWGNGAFIQRSPRLGLDPSETGTWEASVEQNISTLGRSGLVRATYFHTTEQQLFNFGSTPNGVPFYDAARAEGVELWSERRVGRLRPFASFTHLQNRRIGSTNPAATNVDLRFAALPSRAAGFGTHVDATRRLLFVVLGYFDSGGIQEQVVNDSIIVTRFGSFTKVNASGSFLLTERLSLTARIENLLNRHDLGYSRSVLNPDGSTQRVSGTQRDPGIIFAGGFQYRF